MLSEINNIPLWDKDFQNKIKQIIFDWLKDSKLKDKNEIMKNIMRVGRGHYNPKMIEDFVDEYLNCEVCDEKSSCSNMC